MIENIVITGETKKTNYLRTKTHRLIFRVYPVASYTGKVRQNLFERMIMNNIVKRLDHYYKRSYYTVDYLKENFGLCPDEYKCKYFEIPVYVRTQNKEPDKIIWIENW